MTGKELPLVSFIIPTHNRADVLRDCLESVVNQTYTNIEVVVVNDNSQDNTDDILSEYKNRYKFFNYYNNDGKGGNAARNFGIKMANGEYIAFMDDDDICELFRIEEQMKPILENNFYYNFVVSSFYLFGRNGEKKQVTDYLKPVDSIGFTVRWLVKKEILLKVGGFDTEQPALQDVEFFWRLKDISKIFFSKKCVVKVRNSDISVSKNPDKMIDGIKRLLDLHGNKMGKFEQNMWLMNLCKKYAAKNDWINFRLFYKKLNKKTMPFSSLFIFAASFFKSKKALVLHSRFFQFYLKYKLK